MCFVDLEKVLDRVSYSVEIGIEEEKNTRNLARSVMSQHEGANKSQSGF